MLEPRASYEIVPYEDQPAPIEVKPAAPLARRTSALATIAAGIVWLVREIGPDLVHAWQATRLQAPSDAGRLAQAAVQGDVASAGGRRMRRRRGRQT